MNLAVDKYIRGDIWSARFYNTANCKNINKPFELIPVMILGVARGRATVMCFELTELDTPIDVINVSYKNYLPDGTNIVTIPLENLYKRYGALDTKSYINLLKNILKYITGSNIELIAATDSTKLETIKS